MPLLTYIVDSYYVMKGRCEITPTNDFTKLLSCIKYSVADPGYHGSRIRNFPSRIPDPGSKRFRISDRIRIKELRYLQP
jgi:hypothetical protein